MIIAIPLEAEKSSAHFGHSAQFAVIQTDATKTILARHDLDAPPHEPGLLPTWLCQHGVNLVLCGGIGPRAIELCEQKGITVVTGVSCDFPEALVAAYFAGRLQRASNSCDHG
jgi:predicted Fe-Mo cluster-binding NifX family protein